MDNCAGAIAPRSFRDSKTTRFSISFAISPGFSRSWSVPTPTQRRTPADVAGRNPNHLFMATTDNGRLEGGYTYDSFTGLGSGTKKPTESHFLWWCSGAYQGLLKDCPSEQTKYAGLGGVLLATFVLAALSAGYAIHSVFNDLLWAMAFGLIWGLIIFNFDRFLVSTMRKYGVSRRKQLWMAAPRLALALLIGFTIARPLELKIFEKEVDVQITANRHQKMLLNDSLLQAENRSVLGAAQQERDRLGVRQDWRIRFIDYNRIISGRRMARVARNAGGSTN
jgi:hypothetical protein